MLLPPKDTHANNVRARDRGAGKNSGGSRSVREERWMEEAKWRRGCGEASPLTRTYLQGVRGGARPRRPRRHTTNHLPHTGTRRRHGGKPLPTCITSHVHREQRSRRPLMQRRRGGGRTCRRAHSSCSPRHTTRKRTWNPLIGHPHPYRTGKKRNTTSPRAHKLLT